MGEYVININWNGGNGGKGSGGSKGNTTSTAFLAGAASAVTANRLFKNPDASIVFEKKDYNFIDDNISENFYEKADEPQDPFEFFFGRKNWYRDVTVMEDVVSGTMLTSYSNPTTEITLYKKPIAYTAAQGLRILTKWGSTHYQYASAIASSTAEVNAVNEYQNAITGIGLGGSIAAGAAVGAKIGAVGGIIGSV